MTEDDETGLTCYECGEPISLADYHENPGENKCPHCGAGGYSS